MANICTSCLEADIQSNINALTTSSCVEDILAAAVSVNQYDVNNITSSVTNCAALPDLGTCTTIPNGHVVFVDTIKVPVVANNFRWVSFDGRTFRDDLSSAGGCAFVWGYNSQFFGNLGDGSKSHRSSPVTVAGGGTTWKKITPGGFITELSAGIKTDGTLWTWGDNYCGKLGTNNTTCRSSPGTVAGGGTTWSEVALHKYGSAAIKTDGTLWTWGQNIGINNQRNGLLGTGNTTHRSSPGTTAGGGTNWCGIATGDRHIGGVKTDGTLWTWGANSQGQLGDNSTTSRSSPGTTAGGGSNWCFLSGGDNHSIGIKTDGTLWTWGMGSSGQLGENSTTTRSSPGTTIGGGTNWCTACAGNSNSFGIKTDGTLWVWGSQASGWLGDYVCALTARSSPVTIAGGGTTWKRVSHGSAIKTDGTLWTWGPWSCGRLGVDTSSAFGASSPVQVCGGFTTWSNVCSSCQTTTGIKV